MAWKPEKKQESRRLILAAAAQLFTIKGFDAVTIDQVMQRAKLTRGAFYAHFSSKSELYGEAILNAAKEAKRSMQAVPDLSPALMAENYLNIGRGCGPQDFCVLACLVSDINHRDEEIKQIYSRIFKGYINTVQDLGLDTERATQASVLMVGGLALATAVTDVNLKKTILDSCQAAVARLSLARGPSTS